MTNEFILEDRLQKIRQIVGKYGEDKFYLSFSGGKDSTVLHYLLDMAIPGNKIPRVYSNTGIEYQMIIDFVNELAENDDRIVVIRPDIPIKQMLEKKGYPFKSKEHAAVVGSYQNGNKEGKWIKSYLAKEGRFACPQKLRYQFSDDFRIKVSDKCCEEMKEKPLKKWQKENDRPYGMVAIMREEGGRRNRANCLAFNGDKLKNFQPMVAVTSEWEEWFIETYGVKICKIYGEPYNFERTGCKGCPFNPRLQDALDVLQEYFPIERKQCEAIWAPVYAEYRRIGYRLRAD